MHIHADHSNGELLSLQCSAYGLIAELSTHAEGPRVTAESSNGSSNVTSRSSQRIWTRMARLGSARSQTGRSGGSPWHRTTNSKSLKLEDPTAEHTPESSLHLAWSGFRG
jgi:hypothetical protein